MAIDLLRLARQLAGHNKLAVGASIKQTLQSGTQVTVLNKGKGIFEKVIQKTDGSEIRSIFRKTECLRVDGKNARGTWSIIPQKAKSVDWFEGAEDCADKTKKFLYSTNIYGLRRPSASYSKTVGEKEFAEFQLNPEIGWGNLPESVTMIEKGPEWAMLTQDYLIKNIQTATLRVLKAFGRY